MARAGFPSPPLQCQQDRLWSTLKEAPTGVVALPPLTPIHVLPHLEVTVMEDTLKSLLTYLYTYLYSCYKSVEVFFVMGFYFSRVSSSY